MSNGTTTPTTVNVPVPPATGTAATSQPFIIGLLQALPPVGSHWDHEDRVSWLQAADAIFDILYHQPEHDISISATPPDAPPAPPAAPAADSSAPSDGGTAPAPATPDATP